MEFCAFQGAPVNGQPSWFGQYRYAGEKRWRIASGLYGAIHYKTREAALAGAEICAKETRITVCRPEFLKSIRGG